MLSPQNRMSYTDRVSEFSIGIWVLDVLSVITITSHLKLFKIANRHETARGK